MCKDASKRMETVVSVHSRRFEEEVDGGWRMEDGNVAVNMLNNID